MVPYIHCNINIFINYKQQSLGINVGYSLIVHCSKAVAACRMCYSSTFWQWNTALILNTGAKSQHPHSSSRWRMTEYLVYGLLAVQLFEGCMLTSVSRGSTGALAFAAGLVGRAEEADSGSSCFQCCGLSGPKLQLPTSWLFTSVETACVGRAATAWISFGKWRRTWLKSSGCSPEPGFFFRSFCPDWIGEGRLLGLHTASNGAGGGSTVRLQASWQRDRCAAFVIPTSTCRICPETESTWAQRGMSVCWET